MQMLLLLLFPLSIFIKVYTYLVATHHCRFTVIISSLSFILVSLHSCYIMIKGGQIGILVYEWSCDTHYLFLLISQGRQ
ncbi:hypothetical protein B0T20DRAFT_73014 [Sordaria brevicollis]|uniref:Secreted protein n=1 Tax=Sordaria brevicollis TaxID=83679 RepID=A0AAE0P2N5_SORBR|nr:hypothetical protein B0T20DRAFT_73014 [Sordaria brevicollis]